MNIDVICSAKNQTLSQTEVIFHRAENPQQPVHFALGSAIGTPNTPITELQNALDLPKVQEIVYNLVGSLNFIIKDPEEASKYIVGQTYKLSIETPKPVNEKSKKS